MQTNSEITKAEIERRQHAMKYEAAINAAKKYARAVDILRPQIESTRVHLKTIQTMREMALQVPKEISGKGNIELRYVLEEHLVYASRQQARRLDDLEQKLKVCVEELNTNEDLIAEFEKSAA